MSFRNVLTHPDDAAWTFIPIICNDRSYKPLQLNMNLENETLETQIPNSENTTNVFFQIPVAFLLPKSVPNQFGHQLVILVAAMADQN